MVSGMDLSMLRAHANQYGLVTPDEAVLAGFDPRVLAAAARRQLLHRMAVATYVFPEMADDPLLALAVAQRYAERKGRWACAASERTSCLTGRQVLGLLDVEGFSVFGLPLVALPKDRLVRLKDPPFAVIHLPWDVVVWQEVNGLWITDPGLTLAVVAADAGVTDKRLRVACYDLINKGLVTAVGLLERWQQLPLPGAARLLEMAADGFLQHESEGERTCFLHVFVGRGPLPDCQVIIGPYRVDFVFIAAGLIVEYVGERAHVNRMQEDARRTYALEQAGWRIVVVTKAMLGQPERLAKHIHTLRRDRELEVAIGRLPPFSVPPQPPRVVALRTLQPAGAVR